jgi:hypothetical protein
MSYKKIIGGLFIVSLVLAVAGFILANPVSVGICNEIEYTCRSLVVNTVFSVWVLSLSLAIISFVLLFLRKEIFHTWGIYFASWFIPMSAYLIYLAPSNCGGGFGIMGGCLVDREFTTLFMAGTFLIISILIIAIKSYKLHQKKGLFSFFHR